MSNRYQTAKRATFVSAATNTFLAIIKVVAGYFGHSHALIADGIHSFSDLISDALVLIAAKLGGRLPDKDHPYGHQRIETIAAIIIALLLIIIGGAIVYEAASDIIKKTPRIMPDVYVLGVAIISIIANEGLYHYMAALGKKINSNLLISNAWHNRSDAFTSMIVFFTVGGTLLGFLHLDAIGAAIIAIFIIKMGFKMMWVGVKELIDTGVDPNTLEQITQIIKSVPGVMAVHQLRTRLHGGSIFVDVHIIVDSYISVSEGHHIGEQVHFKLLKEVKNLTDVTVHIDPEDDERSRPSLHLPDRTQIEKTLEKHWHNLPGYNQIKKMQIHYIDGNLYIELYMPQNAIDTNEQKSLKSMYQNAIKNVADIADLHIYFTQ